MPLVRKPQAATETPAATDIAELLKALGSGSEAQRWAAARALAERPDTVPRIAEAIGREPSARVREALFTSLARIATPASAEAALEFLRADAARLRSEALDAVVAMKEVAWPYLPALLGDPDADVRVLACELVRTMPDPEASRLLCKLLDQEDTVNVCAAAVDALAEVGSPAAVAPLEHCAARFEGAPFLSFAIATAIERIREQTPRPRG